MFKNDSDFLGLLLPLIIYLFITFSTESKLEFFGQELNKIFYSGHISHKKILIHALNIIDSWFELDKNLALKSSDKKNFINNYEIIKKILKDESLLNALERFFLINIK